MDEEVQTLKLKLDAALLRERLASDTCDAICKIVGYEPKHNEEYSGDRLEEIVRKLKNDYDELKNDYDELKERYRYTRDRLDMATPETIRYLQ